MTTQINSLSDAQFHLFHKHGSAFLFDPATRVYFKLSEAEEQAAQMFFSDNQEAVVNNLPSEVKSALHEFDQLRKQGYFAEASLAAIALDPARAYEFTVHLSMHCNLDCCYCLSHLNSWRSAPAEMSPEVMQQTARFIAERNHAARQTDQVWVGLGGEGMLKRPLLEQFSELLQEEGKHLGMDLRAVLCSTNCTAIKDEETALWLQNFYMGVSIDGPPEAHNAIRIYPDGRGTYSDVCRGLEFLCSHDYHPEGTPTLTALYPDVSEVYFHLFDLGFTKVSIKPVRAHPSQPYAIGQNLSAICAGYERFVERLLSLPEEELLDKLQRFTSTIDGRDYFGRFLLGIIERHPLNRRCEAGVLSATIDTDGKIYFCDSLLGVPEALVGTVWEGINDDKVEEINLRFTVSQRPRCRDCWARYLCGGGCLHQSHLTHGEFDPPDPSECALNQHLIELAIWTHAELKRNRPKVLGALPRVTRKDWHKAPPIPVRNLGALSEPQMLQEIQEIGPSCVIVSRHHLKCRLLGANDELSLTLRLGWNENQLWLLLAPQETSDEQTWKAPQQIQYRFYLPRELSRPEVFSLPSNMQERVICIQIEPGNRRILAFLADCPQHKQQLNESQIMPLLEGYLLMINWQDLGIVPRIESEFGLDMRIQDNQGGILELTPHYQGGRIRLLPGQGTRSEECQSSTSLNAD